MANSTTTQTNIDPSVVVAPAKAPAVKPDRVAIPAPADDDWRALHEQLRANEPILLDMSKVNRFDRRMIGAVVRFLQAAEQSNSPVALQRTPAKTQAMLELLGVHHVAEFID